MTQDMDCTCDRYEGRAIACPLHYPPKTFTKLRWDFWGDNQLPLFMVWREYWEEGKVIHAYVLFNSMDWIGF